MIGVWRTVTLTLGSSVIFCVCSVALLLHAVWCQTAHCAPLKTLADIFYNLPCKDLHWRCPAKDVPLPTQVCTCARVGGRGGVSGMVDIFKRRGFCEQRWCVVSVARQPWQHHTHAQTHRGPEPGREVFFCRVVAGSSWIFMRELIPDWPGLGGTCWLGLGSEGLRERVRVRVRVS